MSKTLSLTNLVDIEADSIMIGDEDIYDIFLTKTSGSDIVGISPEDLNTLQELANAIGNDANFITTINNQIALKRNISDSYSQTYIDNTFGNYYTQTPTTTLLNNKLDLSAINNYYNKTETTTFLNSRYTISQTDGLLDLKMNVADTYTITSTNTLLNNKLDISTYNAGIILKANIADVYNKSVLYTQNETDGLLSLKMNVSDTYNTTSVNLLLNDKLDTTTYNTGIALKANSSDVYNKSSLYTKTETSTLLGNKLDNSALNNYYTQLQINTSFGNYYTKTHIDNEFDNYYLASYIDTDILDLNDDINLKFDSGDIANYYNKTETNILFTNLIDSAPASLNTLNELAAALNDDANYASTCLLYTSPSPRDS